MQKIVPHLWFDTQAHEAALFYSKVFPDSKITYTGMIKDTPSGDCEIVGFSIMDFEFMSISAGPFFNFNPSISFQVLCETTEEVDLIWKKLIKKGKILMDIGSYPFSDRYGWVEDTFGVSWQIMHVREEITQKIVPAFLFTQENYGRAAEALKFYTRIFKNASYNIIDRYTKQDKAEKTGLVKYATFSLENIKFSMMESGLKHDFTYNEAISLFVYCHGQEEIDYYWEALSAVPEAEQCGWLKDRFGVSWQISPENMQEIIDKNPEKVTPVMLQMKKIIIEDLKKAGNN